MRTAVLLLLALALAAVPGSLLPQRGVAFDPGAVTRFIGDNPTLGPWLDRLGFFEVYSSPWFAAIYLLLMVSMTGCVLPRAARLWQSVRAEPPRAPSNLARLDDHRRATVTAEPAEVLHAAAAHLRARRFRVVVDENSVRAEKGYLREVGNLVFHLSLLVLLFGVAIGSLFGFEGRAIVVEGASFTNTRLQYDEFTPGPLTDAEALTPFSLTLDDFTAEFEMSGPQRGSARDFQADVTVLRTPGGVPQDVTVEVNHPLQVEGTKVFLTGHGYAPVVSITDGRGETVFTGPVVFVPFDGNLSSEGVIKVPDAQPTQLGFEGFFLPTASVDPGLGPRSLYPDLVDPQLLLTAYTGNLGLADGAPQSVFRLDKDDLTQVMNGDQPFARALRPGESMVLPGGQGTLTFESVSRFANFQIAHDPGKEIALTAAIALLLGLTVSLAVRRRRIWLRVAHAPGGGAPTVDIATYALTRRGAVPDELSSVLAALPGAEPDPTDVSMHDRED
ncbi:cytochrome c biogenesis protein ResB [Actinotalea sp. Marseille-Q4924]|jgi:cytochrome c biogenesis protein|uniref:cytochrome c biogenesis protein ResB n=1 Tax=Actinotalea sp. Marseille-Q4924 TaxID=2866571 RepID=UPI001CE3FF95|nr:cytochrome c biogenesis protein ResB [Actinotalea sp. Marseille-Q4924]